MSHLGKYSLGYLSAAFFIAGLACNVRAINILDNESDWLRHEHAETKLQEATMFAVASFAAKYYFQDRLYQENLRSKKAGNAPT